MDVRDLVMLAQIAKCGSITKAADQLGMTQPAITKSLKQLEKELSVPLFDRTRTGATPTKFGEVLARYGVTIATEFNRGRAEIYSMIEGVLGEITVGSIAMGTGHIVPIAVQRVSRRHANVSIGIREVSDDVLFSGLQAGLLDVAFAPVTGGEKGYFSESILFHDQLGLYVGSGNPLAKRKRLTLKDLLTCNWIMPPRTSRLLQRFAMEFQHIGHDVPKSHIETASIRAQFALVTRTDLITMIPSHVIQPEVDAGRIVALPVQLHNPAMAFGTATRAGATLSPAVKDLVAEIHAVAEEIGWARKPQPPHLNRRK